MEKTWSRCRGGRADNKKITFIFQNEPFLLLTGYLEFHFRSQGKSGKSQGIPSLKKSGNPVSGCRTLLHSSTLERLKRRTTTLPDNIKVQSDPEIQPSQNKLPRLARSVAIVTQAACIFIQNHSRNIIFTYL